MEAAKIVVELKAQQGAKVRMPRAATAGEGGNGDGCCFGSSLAPLSLEALRFSNNHNHRGTAPRQPVFSLPGCGMDYFVRVTQLGKRWGWPAAPSESTSRHHRSSSQPSAP